MTGWNENTVKREGRDETHSIKSPSFSMQLSITCCSGRGIFDEVRFNWINRGRYVQSLMSVEEVASSCCQARDGTLCKSPRPDRVEGNAFGRGNWRWGSCVCY